MAKTEQRESRQFSALRKLRHYANHLSCVYGGMGGEPDHMLHCCDWAEVVHLCEEGMLEFDRHLSDAEFAAGKVAKEFAPRDNTNRERFLKMTKIVIEALKERGWSTPHTER